MPSLRLTRRAVEQLPAPDPTGRQRLFWDTDMKGFGLLVSGRTKSKTYICQRKLPGGNTRRVTVGAANVLELDAARQQAQKLLGEFYAGVDPKAKRREAALRGKTLQAALDEYLRDMTKLAERSRQGYRSTVQRYLGAWLDLPLRDIDRDMVEKRHRQIAEETAKPGRSGGGENTGHATADGAMRALRAIYNHAVDKDSAMPPNPVRLKKVWFKVDARERFLSGDQLPAFFAAVDGLESSTQRDYLKLLLFTGLRRQEAGSLRWSEVDFASRVIRLPGKKTKSGRRLDLPMSSFVRDLLVARRAVGRENDWVFPAASRSGHISEPRSGLEQVAKATGIVVSAHDLRRTFVTHAEETDISVMALKALVNHAIGGNVTEDYARMTVERLREPAQKICDRLMELCGIATPVGENVAALG
jgi:integrase